MLRACSSVRVAVALFVMGSMRIMCVLSFASISPLQLLPLGCGLGDGQITVLSKQHKVHMNEKGGEGDMALMVSAVACYTTHEALREAFFFF